MMVGVTVLFAIVAYGARLELGVDQHGALAAGQIRDQHGVAGQRDAFVAGVLSVASIVESLPLHLTF